MRKLLYFLFIPVLILAAFQGCGDKDDDVDSGTIDLNRTSCTLNNSNKYAIIKILKGDGNYRAKSSDENVAVVAIEGSDIYIFGRESGNAAVTVVDASSNRAEIAVNVSEYISQVLPVTQMVYVKKGSVKELTIPEEYRNYPIIYDDESVAKAQIKSDKIIFEGLTNGSASFYIIENIIWPVWIYKVEVVDEYELQVSDSQMNISLSDEDNAHVFYIRSGNGGYTVVSSDEAVATCEILPYERIITDGLISNPAMVKVTPLGTGEVTFTVKDDTGRSAEVKVNIYD